MALAPLLSSNMMIEATQITCKVMAIILGIRDRVLWVIILISIAKNIF